LKVYLDNRNLFEFLISKIIEYIEIWDDCLLVEFGISLGKLFRSSADNKFKVYEGFKNIYNQVIKFLIKIITLNDEGTNVTYINTFNEIVAFYSSYKKLKLEQALIEYVISLGYFGKDIRNRRCCVYFASSLLQISMAFNNELFNRVMMLSAETEKLIRQEVAYHMKFILKTIDEDYIKKNLLKFFESYLGDNNLIVQIETLCCCLEIYYKVEKYISININKLIIDLFSNPGNFNDFEKFKLLSKLFTHTLDNNMYNCVNLFLDNFVFIKNPAYTIDNFDFIFSKLDIFLDTLNTNGDIEKFQNYLIKNLLNNNENTKISTNELRQSFFETIEVYIEKVPKDIQNKLFKSLYSVFDEKGGGIKNVDLSPEIQNMGYCLAEEFKIDFLKNLKNIFSFQDKIDNRGFYMLLGENFSKVQKYVKENCSAFWRISLYFFDALNSTNYIFKISEDLLLDLVNSVEICFLINLNYQVNLEIINLSVKLLDTKYYKEIIVFINDEILDAESFYIKRYYYNFIALTISKKSITFCIKNCLIANFLKFFNFDIETMAIINLVKFIIPFLNDTEEKNILKNIEKYRSASDKDILKVIYFIKLRA
jgi:hypothetical protein